MSGDRALDAEVARAVFGIDTKQLQYCERWEWEPHQTYNQRCPRCGAWRLTNMPDMKSGPCLISIPAYSSDVAAAMLVVDRWTGDASMRRQNGFWLVTFFRPSEEFRSVEPTLPEALCRAALAAVRGDGEAG